MISSRQADIINRLKNREPQIKDTVRIKPDMLPLLGPDNEQYYAGNTGTVLSKYHYGYDLNFEIKWHKKINTKENTSTLSVKYLEIV